VKGKGLVGKTGKGDLYVVLKVVMPGKESPDLHELWQQMADKAAFDPRAEWGKKS
jgi:curved DNA-binding protein